MNNNKKLLSEINQMKNLVRYMEGKTIINENEITANPVVQNLEKKAFDFFNSPKVVELLKKELSKLPPEKKAELAQSTLEENQGDDFGSFKSTVEKSINTNALTEEAYDKAYVPSELNKSVGKVLVNLGVANIMSMGFLPALSAMALDYFGGTDIVNTLSTAIGSGSGAAALSVIAGLIGGGLAWKAGKILQNIKTTDNTPLF